MPVRQEPTHRAEQVTQLLFGERAMVLEETRTGWARIKCTWDGYEGWCRLSQVTELPAKEFSKGAKYYSDGHNGRLLFEKDGEMLLPAGSELIAMKHKVVHAINFAGLFKGKRTEFADCEPTEDNLRTLALQYLHAPYQWGGRSVMGIDCSGLSQIVYKMCNVALPRDASQQALQGNLVDFLETARCGDLAFFDNQEERIVHVGIMLDNKTIIHATEIAGKVVVDRIDQGGIISISLRKRTHNLRFIRRMV